MGTSRAVPELSKEVHPLETFGQNMGTQASGQRLRHSQGECFAQTCLRSPELLFLKYGAVGGEPYCLKTQITKYQN